MSLKVIPNLAGILCHKELCKKAVFFINWATCDKKLNSFKLNVLGLNLPFTTKNNRN